MLGLYPAEPTAIGRSVSCRPMTTTTIDHDQIDIDLADIDEARLIECPGTPVALP